MRSTLHPTLQYLLRNTLLYAVREYCQCALPEASCNTHGCSLPRPRLPPTCTRAYGRRCGCGCGCACSRRAPTASTCTSSYRATSPYAQRRRPASQPPPPCTRTHRALAPTLHSHPPCTQTHPALAPTLHSHPPCVRSAASLHPRASPSRTSPPTLHPPYALPPCALTVPFPLRQPGGQRLPLRPSQHLAARDLHSTSAADTGVRRRGLRPVGRGAGGAYGAAHLQLLASSLSPPPPP
jgi:hypothetical protein